MNEFLIYGYVFIAICMTVCFYIDYDNDKPGINWNWLLCCIIMGSTWLFSLVYWLTVQLINYIDEDEVF